MFLLKNIYIQVGQRSKRIWHLPKRNLCVWLWFKIGYERWYDIIYCIYSYTYLEKICGGKSSIISRIKWLYWLILWNKPVKFIVMCTPIHEIKIISIILNSHMQIRRWLLMMLWGSVEFAWSALLPMKLRTAAMRTTSTTTTAATEKRPFLL